MNNLYRTNLCQHSAVALKPNTALQSLPRNVSILLAWLCAVLLQAWPQPVSASMTSDQMRQKVVYEAPFHAAKHDKDRVLDWRNPIAKLTFDVPDNDWVDQMDLLLSAHPDGPVSKTAPLLIRFNDAPAVPVYTDGNGFDARIKLDTSFLKARGNIIRAEYQTPQGQRCLSARHGAWVLNLEDSEMVVHARTQSQPPNFSKIKTRLRAPATAPKTVAIKVIGPNTLRLEALAAQGIALNMQTLPKFKILKTAERTHADISIIVAKRQQLPQNLRDRELVAMQGPAIAISQTHPDHLIITGDTDTDVELAVEAFAQYPIPSSRKYALGPTAYYGPGAFSRSTKLKSGKARLTHLGLNQFDPGWRPNPQHILFDVADPAATFGRLDLKFFIDGEVDKQSYVNVVLNDQILGQVQLSGTRTLADLPVPQGLLQGTGNHLTFAPSLYPVEGNEGCRARTTTPRLSISSKSSLNLKTDFVSPDTDLSRFAATGLPFAMSHGADTTILIGSNNTADRNAALQLMAKMALISGTGWTKAKILEATTENWPDTGNVLLVGGNIDQITPALMSAPVSLTVAITGQTRQTPRIMKAAEVSSAGLKVLSTKEIISGGVAALYTDTENSRRVIGVITGSRGHTFARVAENILQPEHWNALEGSVVRWDENTVLMTQTALTNIAQAQTRPAWENVISIMSAKLNAIRWPDIGAFKGQVLAKLETPLVAEVYSDEANSGATIVVPELRNERLTDEIIPSLSHIPSPQLKPDPSRRIDGPETSLYSIKSRGVPTYNKPKQRGVVMQKVSTLYSTQSQRLSRATRKILKADARAAYASKPNQPQVLLLSLIATALLLMLAILIPVRRT